MQGETDPTGEQEQSLQTPLQYLPGMGPVRAQRFSRLGLRNAQDVIFLFQEIMVSAAASKIDDLQEGEPASLVGKVIDAEFVSRRPGRSMFAALIENESGVVRTLFSTAFPFRSTRVGSVCVDFRNAKNEWHEDGVCSSKSHFADDSKIY